ncbi:hypothetical protein Dip518_001326 [Parelusimicrobium proximum]|uniref:hypothetical protein n=1 Tax=Parelusimicrobium proximum TaxID=3228953 RepID=UPI003D169388
MKKYLIYTLTFLIACSSVSFAQTSEDYYSAYMQKFIEYKTGSAGGKLAQAIDLAADNTGFDRGEESNTSSNSNNTSSIYSVSEYKKYGSGNLSIKDINFYFSAIVPDNEAEKEEYLKFRRFFLKELLVWANKLEQKGYFPPIPSYGEKINIDTFKDKSLLYTSQAAYRLLDRALKISFYPDKNDPNVLYWYEQGVKTGTPLDVFQPNAKLHAGNKTSLDKTLEMFKNSDNPILLVAKDIRYYLMGWQFKNKGTQDDLNKGSKITFEMSNENFHIAQ